MLSDGIWRALRGRTVAPRCLHPIRVFMQLRSACWPPEWLIPALNLAQWSNAFTWSLRASLASGMRSSPLPSYAKSRQVVIIMSGRSQSRRATPAACCPFSTLRSEWKFRSMAVSVKPHQSYYDRKGKGEGNDTCLTENHPFLFESQKAVSNDNDATTLMYQCDPSIMRKKEESKNCEAM